MPKRNDMFKAFADLDCLLVMSERMFVTDRDYFLAPVKPDNDLQRVLF